MKSKSLEWYLLQEAILSEEEKKDYSKYGKNLIPGGAYSNNLKEMIQQIRSHTGKSVTLASERKGAIFKNMEVSTDYNVDNWIKFFSQDIERAKLFGDLIAQGASETSGEIATIKMSSDWLEVAKNETMSRRFLAFWLCEILKDMGFAKRSEITMDDFQFRYQGNSVTIIHTGRPKRK